MDTDERSIKLRVNQYFSTPPEASNKIPPTSNCKPPRASKSTAPWSLESSRPSPEQPQPSPEPVRSCKPFLLLGNQVQRICLQRDEEDHFLVNANEIWELMSLDPAEQAAQFVVDRTFPNQYAYRTISNTGRLLLSPSPEADRESPVLFVSAELLPQLLLDADGMPVPLRMAPNLLMADMHEATCRDPAALVQLQRDKELDLIDRRLDESASPAPIQGSPVPMDGSYSKELPTSNPEQLECELTSNRRKAFRIMLVVMLLAIIGVMVTLMLLWLAMAQSGIEQPGENYLTVTNEMVVSAMDFALYPCREATVIMYQMGGAHSNCFRLGTRLC